MDSVELKKLLIQVEKGETSVNRALGRLRHMPYESLGFATIDHHRYLRQGRAEVIFCEGKQTDQTLMIMNRMVAARSPVLATRANPDLFRTVKKKHPRAVYHSLARMISIPYGNGSKRPKNLNSGKPTLIITAGTSDIPVAEEAKVTLESFENHVETIYDVGVAGLHRLLNHREQIEKAHVLIVVAGMDGVLASVVGGWVDKPVVAVPTSIGYGSGAGGMAALLCMLNSCAPGLAVVNIDNGFGAAVLADRINRLHYHSPEPPNRRIRGRKTK